MIIERALSLQASKQLVELANKRLSETRPSVLHSDLITCDTFDEMYLVCGISQPTLVICGADDQHTPARSAQYLIGKTVDARVEIIPDSAHKVILEQP